MPRQILPEGQESKNEQAQSQGSATEETSFGFASLSSDELDKLFHEWDASGKNDLLVEPDLANRVREYLAHQKELDALRLELAERIYKPFEVTIGNASPYSTLDIYVNNIRVFVDASLYKFGGSPCTINLSAFKSVALALGNSHASYIPEDKISGVDLFAYLVSIGKSCDYNGFSIRIKS